MTIFPWLMDNEPESLEKAAVNLTSKDWTKYCLTGEMSVDYSMASVALLDYSSMSISKEVLDLVGISQYAHLFPKLVPSWEIAGYVTKKRQPLPDSRKAPRWRAVLSMAPVRLWARAVSRWVRPPARWPQREYMLC